VQDIATATLALGLNGLGPIGTGLAGVLGGVEVVDNALDDMRPGSTMLTRLAGSDPAPGVSYVAIAGDRPFGPGRPDHGEAARAGRILGKVGLALAAERMLFGGAPNDLAVSTASASGFGAGWPTPPTLLDAGCNHFEYFAVPAAVDVVRRGLGLPPRL
jgi:hypothetical protein